MAIDSGDLVGGGSVIKSIQRGSQIFGRNDTGTIIISSVDLNKSFLSTSVKPGYFAFSNGVDPNTFGVGARLSNSTTIAWVSQDSWNVLVSGTLYWEVIEYV